MSIPAGIANKIRIALAKILSNRSTSKPPPTQKPPPAQPKPKEVS